MIRFRNFGFAFSSLVLLLPAVALVGLLFPLYVIRPFRPQGAGELQAALFVLRYRGIVEVLAAVAGLVTLGLWWRGQNRSIAARITGLTATILILLCAVFSRVNVFEILFHPVDQPSFEPVSATHLDGDQKVIAVRIGNAARAYPVRNIGYHHIVNDVLGGVPIAATY